MRFPFRLTWTETPNKKTKAFFHSAYHFSIVGDSNSPVVYGHFHIIHEHLHKLSQYGGAYSSHAVSIWMGTVNSFGVLLPPERTVEWATNFVITALEY